MNNSDRVLGSNEKEFLDVDNKIITITTSYLFCLCFWYYILVYFLPSLVHCACSSKKRRRRKPFLRKYLQLLSDKTGNFDRLSFAAIAFDGMTPADTLSWRQTMAVVIYVYLMWSDNDHARGRKRCIDDGPDGGHHRRSPGENSGKERWVGRREGALEV